MFTEWEQAQRRKYSDEHGQPMPKPVAVMIAYNGRVVGRVCRECQNFYVEKNRITRATRLRCARSDAANWKGDYPACGLFAAHENNGGGDSPSPVED
jgi:hypothetical protein